MAYDFGVRLGMYDNTMTFEDNLYHDFLLISKMKVSEKTKIRILTELFGETENPWRVIGITINALKIFKDNDFNRISGMGINRAHIKDRKITYTKMVSAINSREQQ